MSLEKGEIEQQEKPLASHHDAPSQLDGDGEMATYDDRSLDWTTIMAIIALAFGYEAALLSFILPAQIINAINADIGPSTQANWIAGAWTLSTAVTQTISGRMTDIFGRRYTMICGNIFGFVGCTIAARAQSVNMVIAGTTLMGIGAGAQQLAYACVNEVVPKKSRGRIVGIFSTSAIPGAIFGAPIAFAMVGHASWRWAFYLGMIVNGCGVIMVTVFYHPPGFLGLHPEGKSAIQQFKELDFVGLLLFSSGLTAFLVALSLGGNPYSWTSATVLGPLLAGGILLFVIFPAWEVYCPSSITKLLPPELFKNIRGFSVPLVTVFVSGMMYYSLQALWPQQIQLLYTTVPVTIGWYAMALGAGATVGGIMIGLLFAKIKHTKWQFLSAICLQTLGIGLMATVNQNTPGKAIAFVALTGIGIGVCQIVGLLTIQLGANDADIGVATGITGTARTTGGSIAIAIYGAVIHGKVGSDLGPSLASAAVKAGLDPSNAVEFILAITSGSATALQSVKGITPAIIAAGSDALTNVYSSAFKLTYLVSLAFGAIAILAALFVRSVDDLLTGVVAVELRKPIFYHEEEGKNNHIKEESSA